MAKKTLQQVPSQKQTQPQPAVPTPTLTPEQVAALKKFSDQATEFWNDVLDARTALCLLVRVTWVDGLDDDDKVPETGYTPDDIKQLSTFGQSVSETLRVIVLRIQECGNKFDHAQIEFHRLLDSLSLPASMSEAPSC